MVSVNPGTLATPVHNLGGSIRVTVDVSGGWPFIRIVIFAPTANGPSILAITMTSPRHSAGFVHTAHTSSALAEEWDDPPNGPFASPMSVILPRGVAIAPGFDFDPERGGSFVRLSFAGPTSDIEEALRRMAAWLPGQINDR